MFKKVLKIQCYWGLFLKLIKKILKTCNNFCCICSSLCILLCCVVFSKCKKCKKFVFKNVKKKICNNLAVVCSM